LPPLLPSDS